TGLAIQQLVFFRPERLVTHELLVRVSADIFVSDGTRYEDLGINFRTVVSRILSVYIEPEIAAICDLHAALAEQARSIIDEELSSSIFMQSAPAEKRRTGFKLSRLLGSRSRKKQPVATESPEQREQRIIASWDEKAGSTEDRLTAAIFGELVRIARAIVTKHGRLRGDKALLTTLATGLVCNSYGSEIIGEAIAPMVAQAAAREGFPVLPAQAEPIVINVKGASASGKSTMRPLQKKHTEKLGINWHDFALISPDIWRKFLLDYDALGEAYKYAGTLVGDEIPIVDQKLDRYIAQKAEQGRISHLLIDRFRFDSFAPGKDTEEGSNLLTRFGHTVYLTFMVTPPEATVERAWIRGLQVGRFKAVDDLLDHNVEAFKGIPALFFTWALRQDKFVYYEFLDNSVARGDKPRTIAFGVNGELNILDFKCMFDIERYTKINIDALDPADVYPPGDEMNPALNTGFLVKCARKIPKINFVDRACGQIYACMESGKMSWIDPDRFNRVLDDEAAMTAFSSMLPKFVESRGEFKQQAAAPLSDEVRLRTMGSLR
ncbi:MAG: zeta toxin family protein, partial [Gammaproteobacteria bacterium]|nr:zeta toxin family protein [Gammaproteobacteria bacterium]